jgi:hypothetical protein
MDTPPPSALWLYGLPGSGLGFTASAGAPGLEQLEAGAGVGAGSGGAGEGSPGGEGGPRIWIFYGSLARGLAELVARLPEGEEGGRVAAMEAALGAWQADLARAAALKRRWRERIRLVNLCRGGEELEQLLARELPELAYRRRGPEGLADGLVELAMRGLLQWQPGLLNAWLDAEHWADGFGGGAPAGAPAGAGREGGAADWRQPMPLPRLLQLLLQAEGGGGLGKEGLEERCSALEQELQRERRHGELLQRHLEQMERELDHYAGSYERTVELSQRLPELLQRARRLIQVQASA